MHVCACILLFIYISVWCYCALLNLKYSASRNYVYKSSHFYVFKHKAYLHNLLKALVFYDITSITLILKTYLSHLLSISHFCFIPSLSVKPSLNLYTVTTSISSLFLDLCLCDSCCHAQNYVCHISIWL